MKVVSIIVLSEVLEWDERKDNNSGMVTVFQVVHTNRNDLLYTASKSLNKPKVSTPQNLLLRMDRYHIFVDMGVSLTW